MPLSKVIDLKRFLSEADQLKTNDVANLDLIAEGQLRSRIVVSKEGSWPLSVQPEEHIFVVLEGTLSFDIAPAHKGEPDLTKLEHHVLGVGEAIVIPANMAHGGSVVRGPAMTCEVTHFTALSA